MRHSRKLGRRPKIGLSVAAALGERQLVQVRQDVVKPAPRLIDVVAAVRVGGPIVAPAPRGKSPGRLFEVQNCQPKLFQVVPALEPARRFGAAWTAGSSRAIRMPMIVITTNSSTT